MDTNAKNVFTIYKAWLPFNLLPLAQKSHSHNLIELMQSWKSRYCCYLFDY